MELVVFSVTMEYQNLDLRDWNANILNHEKLIQESLLVHVAGLREDDIIGISAADRSTRRLAANDATNNNDALIPAECKEFIQTNIGDFSIHGQRILIIKRLEIVINLNIRPQYFNRTDPVTIEDVFNLVKLRIDASANDILTDLQTNSTYFASAIWLSTTYSSFSSVVSRSANPSSSPTSQPSCGTGSYQLGNGCGPCAEGYYSDSLNAFQCVACPIDTFSSTIGSVQCTSCEKFTSNIKDASTSCPHYTLNASAFTYYFLGAFITTIFLWALLFADENIYIMFLLGLFPLLDITSDIIYILSVKFWNFELFVCSIVFFVIPSSMFIYKLFHMKAYPRLMKFVGVEIMNGQHIWLSVSVDGFPLINGERSTLSYEEHDGIEKLAWYWLLWLLLIAFQVIFILSSIVWHIIALVLLVVWLFIGLFLYQTKMLAIGKVWNVWFFTWTRSNDFSKELSLDASILNESLFHEFILETVPQIAIQSINNSLIYNGHLPAISVFSLAMSIFITINGIYRYGYFLLWKGVKFDEIPLPLAVRMHKINKSFLPRRSMLTKKIASLVNAVKVSDSKMMTKATPGSIRRMSQVMLVGNPTPSAVISSINYYLNLGLMKLKCNDNVESTIELAASIHEFKELVSAVMSLKLVQDMRVIATLDGRNDKNNDVSADISIPTVTDTLNNVLTTPERVLDPFNSDLEWNSYNSTAIVTNITNNCDSVAIDLNGERNQGVIDACETGVMSKDAQIKIISKRNSITSFNHPNKFKNNTLYSDLVERDSIHGTRAYDTGQVRPATVVDEESIVDIPKTDFMAVSLDESDVTNKGIRGNSFGSFDSLSSDEDN